MPKFSAAVPAAIGCCSPLAREPMSDGQARLLAGVLKAMADPGRLRLLSLIASHAGGEACVCDLTGPLGLSQPTVSHHLKVLHDAGLLHREKRGVWVYYRTRPEALAALAEVIGAPALLRRGLAPAVSATSGTVSRSGR